MKYIKLFETMAQYESYMAGEPIFPNVSYTEDNSEVHFLQSKPLATVLRLNNFYESEFEYINSSLIELQTGNINIVNGIMSNGEVCPNNEFLDYLKELKFENSSGELVNFTSINFYDLDRIYFVTEDNDVGMGWFCGNWSGPSPVPITKDDENYGLFQYLPA